MAYYMAHTFVCTMVSVIAITANITKIKNPVKERNKIIPIYLTIDDFDDNDILNVNMIIIVAMDDNMLSMIDLPGDIT